MIETHDPREFIADPPGAMAGMVLVHPGALESFSAPTLYDITVDEHRPATQDDVDALNVTAARFVKLRDGLALAVRLVTETGGSAVAVEALNALLASVDPKA